MRLNFERFILIAFFFYPMLLLRFPNLNLTLADLFIMFSWIVYLISYKGRIMLRKGIFFSQKTFYIGIILFFIGLCLSSLLNSVSLNFFTIIIQYVFCLVLLPLILQASSSINAKKMLVAIVSGVGIVVIIGVVLHYFFPNSAIFLALSQGNGRVFSLLENPNSFGKAIAMTIPIVISFIFISIGQKRILYIILLALLLFGLMLSSSYGSLISAGMSIILFMVLVILKYRKNISNLFKILVSFISVFSILMYIAYKNIPDIFLTRILETSGESGSYDIKVILMQEALDIIQNNFIFGIGLGNHGVFSQYNINVHNTYLLILSEGGVISFIGLLLILTSIGLLFIKVAIKTTEHRHIFLITGIICSYFVFLLNAVTNTHIYGRFWWVFVFAGILVSKNILDSEVKSKISHKDQ